MIAGHVCAPHSTLTAAATGRAQIDAGVPGAPRWRGVRSRGGPAASYGRAMITCVVKYVIDPAKIEAFERFARRWIELVNLHGGTHHGYFLPSEGASDEALALFSFPSFARYEQYRERFGVDPEFNAANQIRDDSGCVLRYERTFMRPLLPER